MRGRLGLGFRRGRVRQRQLCHPCRQESCQGWRETTCHESNTRRSRYREQCWSCVGVYRGHHQVPKLCYICVSAVAPKMYTMGQSMANLSQIDTEQDELIYSPCFVSFDRHQCMYLCTLVTQQEQFLQVAVSLLSRFSGFDLASHH